MTAREWYRPLPPPRTLTWSMRNNTNYMETGVLSALELTASIPENRAGEFLPEEPQLGGLGLQGCALRLRLPANQKDLTRVAFMVNVLRKQGIEVGEATAEFKLGDVTYPAGSLVLKRNQPYGRLAKILLEKQNFPTDAQTTYDDTGWTMGLMSHAKMDEIADKAILDVPVKNIVDMYEPAGVVKGSGAGDRDPAQRLQQSHHAALSPEGSASSKRSSRPSRPAIPICPPGTLLVASGPRVKAEVEKLGLQAVALAAAPDVQEARRGSPARSPCSRTWGSTQDLGWVRYAFDKFEINYDLIYKERIKQGNLRARVRRDRDPQPGWTRRGAKG